MRGTGRLVDIFDRLGNLIRTILDDDDADRPGRPGFTDPDMSQAWDELEDYINEGSDGKTTRPFSPASGGVPEYLRKDYRNLEVTFGESLDVVRKAYKKLMTAFHPDRHSADPDKFRTATEVTKKLNQSFQRIREYHERGA